MRILLTAAGLGPLPGRVVAGALARGWREVNPGAEIEALGVSDGDRGLLDAVEATLGGTRHVVTVRSGAGPDATAPSEVPVVVLVAGATAYVETRDVLGSADGATAAGPVAHGAARAGDAATAVATARAGTSFGVGQLVAAAVDRGTTRVVLGTGTPATLDAGTGMLRALAGREATAFDPDLAEAELEELLQAARTRCAGVEIVLIAPEPVPARGLRGAAAQLTTALGPAASQELDARLTRLVRRYAEMTPRRRDLLAGPAPHLLDPAQGSTASAPLSGPPGSGSGGGLGLAVLALGGRVVPGPSFLAAECGLVGRADGCDLVVVVTEHLDPVEADRGVTAAVASAAAPHGVAVLALAEQVRLERRTAASAGISAVATLAPREDAPPTGGRRADADADADADAVAALAHRHARAWLW